MGLVDAIFIVLISTVVCLALPKLLHILQAPKSKPAKSSLRFAKSKRAIYESTSFPYCTSYLLAGSPSCKFSPSFCAKCSVY